MKASGIFDAPVQRPDEDLLEMAVYARPLAEFIHTTEPPFTIGIYGEWGSGKTSFVRLLEHYLGSSPIPGSQPVRFIRFSAWPYRTSDEIWRALVLSIARGLYDVPEPTVANLGATPAPEPESSLTRLTRFLRGDAFVIRAQAEPPDPLAAYKELVARLDRSQTTIARGADQIHADGDEKLIALVKAASAALGTLSPLVAGVKTVFGFEDKIDLAGLFRRNANETVREQIESVTQFQEIFRCLFKARAIQERICIFIDDLDRTMPDLALDLLEAVRIFLGEVRAIFIVAADEHLIGQGLRLRYRELLHQWDSARVQALFEQKGREYFEKCIQLGIRVPQRTAQQTHRLISALFPKWLPATDIIQVAIGDNPRRLKQYCNWLHYKQRAVGEQTASVDDFDALLEKVVSLHAWSPGPDAKLLSCLRRITATPSSFAPILAHVEDRLAAAAEADPQANSEPTIPLASEMYDLVTSSSPLRSLFGTAPLLSSASPLDVAVLVELADTAPDSEVMIKSSDACFMRILEIAARQGTLSEDRLLQEDFARLISISQKSPEILDRLHEIASDEGWTKRLLDLEKALQSDDPKVISTLVPPASAILSEIRQQPTARADDLSQLLLGPPGLSALLREEVSLFWDLHADLPDPASLLNVKLVQNLKDQDRSSTLARWLLEEKLRNDSRKERKEEIASWLRTRIRAARHLLKLRTFAKLDAFTHCWPDLASRLRTDFSALVALESQALQPQQALPPVLEQLWEQYRHDDRLLAFLKLRPLFRDIPRQESDRFLLMAQATEAHAPTVKASPAEVGNRPVMEDLQPSYEDIRLAFRERSVADPEHQTYDLRISSALGEAQVQIELSESQLQQAVAFLNQLHRAEIRERDLHVSPRLDFPTSLRRLGELLFRTVFQGQAGELIWNLLSRPASWRILWEFHEAPALMTLPWECIFAPDPLRTFLALTRRYSLVRSLPAAPARFNHNFVPPLRLLAVFPAPRDLPPLNSEGEEEVLRRCIEEGGGRVQLEVLRPTVTWERLKEKFETFRPHIFHFVGHGVVKGSTAALMVEDIEGRGRVLESSDLATLLRDSQLNLAVLNACNTGTAPTADAITGLAGALIQAGVSAVVGTTRKVPDDAALLFTREFYRCFLSGLAVEGSVVEARKALSIEKWDWSLYALFSALREGAAGSDLDSLRLPPNKG